MRSRFGNLGFTLRQPEDLEDLFRQAAAEGQTVKSPRGSYIVWTPGGGIELWVQFNAQSDLIGCTPHFSGLGRMRLAVARVVPDPGSLMDGVLVGWVDPAGDDPESGAYKFAIDVPDFDLVRDRVRLLSTLVIQPAAFARRLRCFPDDAAFATAQDDGTAWSPESFLPAGLYGYDGGENEHPKAEAAFAGHVQHAELHVNPITGEPFRHVIARTLGGLVDVVADPLNVTGEPTVGGVVQGAFELTGRIVSGVRPVSLQGGGHAS